MDPTSGVLPFWFFKGFDFEKAQEPPSEYESKTDAERKPNYNSRPDSSCTLPAMQLANRPKSQTFTSMAWKRSGVIA
jgi:hypothetical protein